MYKNYTGFFCSPPGYIGKLLLMMKLTTFILTITLMQVSASTFGQKVTLVETDITLEQVFREIRKQTGYNILIRNTNFKTSSRINVNFQDISLEQVLDQLLERTSLTYLIDEKTIVFKEKLIVEKANIPPPKEAIMQQHDIRGSVTDPSGEPLIGVAVQLKGTNKGTATDLDGRFELTDVSENDVLVVSYVGYQTQEIPINGRTNITVVLLSDLELLEEVVIIGYGSREKKDLTGAVSVIDSEEITKAAGMSPELSMQGRMAGVLVSNPGSDPNARPSIRIRGVSTLGFNDPLYVIDGIPLIEGGASAPGNNRIQDIRGNVNVFNLINPNDIESISVLKDASATAIYGVRASNGVILITTKRGTKGKPKVDVSSRFGIQNVYKDWDVMSTSDFVNTYLEALNNNPSATPDPNFHQFFDSGSPEYLGNNPDYTDQWLKAARVENAAIQDYNISISGGGDISTYSVGAGFANQENAMFYSNFNRYSAFVNSDHNLTNWLKVGESFRFMYSKTENAQGNDGLNTAFGPPWQPLYNPNGLNAFAQTGRMLGQTFLSSGYGGATRSNFLAIEDLNTLQSDLIRNIGSFYAEATLLPGLRIKGTFSFDHFTNTQERFLDQRRGLFESDQGLPYVNEGNTYRRRVNENINIVKEFLVGYNRIFGEHNFDLILNAMDQRVQWNFTQNSIDQNSILPDWDQRRIDEGWAQTDKRVLYERTPSGLQGYMGRLSYNYAAKYYLDLTIRRDGTSKFGPGYKWGTFPSIAGAWRISAEKFMQGSGIDDLKLRVGWGKTGNQETRDFAFLSLVNFNPVYSLGSGEEPGDGIIQSAAALGDFPITDMTWETVTTSNIGIDALLLDNRLSLTMEYYQRYTDGILQAIDIPLIVGALTQPVVNLANVDNRGIELQAGFRDNIGELGYSASINLTTVRNRVSNLYRGRPSGGSQNRVEEGRPINFLWGYITDGIFQSEGEVQQWLDTYSDPGNEAQKAPGDIRFVDIQGPPSEEDGENAFFSPNPDGQIDAFDQTYIGKIIPGYFYGINLAFDYKGFDLSLDFRGIGDVQRIFTSDRQSVDAGGGNYLADILDRWTPSNPSNTIPRAIHDDPSGNNRIADRHVVDAGFFRFQNFQLGYNFKGNLLEKVGISNLRAYLMGQNLLVFSPYPGLDPENDTTPTSFILGVNLSL